jgi:hypothetical protein
MFAGGVMYRLLFLLLIASPLLAADDFAGKKVIDLTYSLGKDRCRVLVHQCEFCGLRTWRYAPRCPDSFRGKGVDK